MDTSFNMPEQDQHQWIVDIDNFPFNIQSIKYKSPTIPLHFDKKFLPKNLCEKEIINVSQCLILQNILQSDISKMCNFQISHFEVCRRHRDIRILQSIKKWETQHFTGLDKQNKGFYHMGLNRKLDRLQDQLQRQPSTIKGIEKATILQAEIKQIKWRLGYIDPLKQAAI